MPSSRRRSVPGKRALASAKGAAAAAKRPAAPGKRASRFSFIGDTIGELKKVTWLTRREALYLSGLVLLVAVSVGIVLGLLDLGLSEIVERFLLNG
ncbi:MAG: preprotein translocase subunit SecE [Dehalococcoidales bacterium]